MKAILIAAVTMLSFWLNSYSENVESAIFQVFQYPDGRRDMKVTPLTNNSALYLEGEILRSNIKVTELTEDNIVTVFTYPDGKHLMAVNFPYESDNRKDDYIPQIPERIIGTNLSIAPNPIESFANLSLKISKDCSVEIFAFDYNFKERIFFSGFLKKGDYDLTYDFTEFQKGLITIGIRENGNITSLKALKL